VLVLSDLLGMDAQFQPRFARRYFDGAETVVSSVNAFVRDVRAAAFPAGKEILA
jgi:3-methyl-2-oxobutanoate hydroxymethyltransferase